MTPYIYVASAEHCGDYKIKLGFESIGMILKRSL